MNLLKYINDVNILLVGLDILLLVISFIFLNKRKVNSKIKDLFVIVYTLLNLFLFSYFNSIFQGIFTLKYLSVKLYLVMIFTVLSIFLYTFNKKVKLVYMLTNYLMVCLISIIFILNIFIIINDKLDLYNIMDISNSIILMNISYIIFSIYLMLLGFGYIGYYLYELYLLNYKKEIVKDNKEKKINFIKVKQKVKKKKEKKEVLENVNDNSSINEKSNTLEVLSNYKVGDKFYINGIDCSIIFCDSNKENIIKNYDILSQDITAKLVNGYTLNENIMIKDICNKLNVSNLGGIDINNLGLLNVINVDEYMFLKQILGEN